jgi:hypothetical protein
MRRGSLVEMLFFSLSLNTHTLSLCEKYTIPEAPAKKDGMN